MKSFRITALVLVCVLAAVVLFAAPGVAHAQTAPVQANGLTNVDFIWTGQALIIP